MDIVGTFNHLIPSDQLEDSLLLGQNLECEASDEFASSHNLPEDSLKNMLSDKDPMFGSASTQFHLLEPDDPNFQLPETTVSTHDMNSPEISQTSAPEDEAQSSFPRGRRKGAPQIQRKQTGTRGRGRGRGGMSRGVGPFRGVSSAASLRRSGRKLGEKPNEEQASPTNSLLDDSNAEKREALLSRRFNVDEIDPSMRPVVVLRRLTVTVGGYKIELLPGPSHMSGSFNAEALQALSYQDDAGTLAAEGIGFNLDQNQALEVHSAPEVVQEVNVGDNVENVDGVDNKNNVDSDMPMDFGPYVNPNDVQDTNGALPFKPNSTEAPEPSIDTKNGEEVQDAKPASAAKLQNKTNKSADATLKPSPKKLQSKPKQAPSMTKNKQTHLTKSGTLPKPLKPPDKKVQKGPAAEENLQNVKNTKTTNAGLKRPTVSLTPKPASKLPKLQVSPPAKQNANPTVPASPTLHRKPSSDSSPATKPVTNKSPHSVKKPVHQNPLPSPTAVKPSQPAKDGPAEEEHDKLKVKKPEKILQRQRSRNSRSVSIDEPELFIPDNAPVVKKGPAEGDPPPTSENETTWDSSKQCGLCKKPHNNRFMVGCGRCDEWFHGECVGLDLAKVQQMEKDDQEYVCLKCCAEEDEKVDAHAAEPSENTTPQKQKPGTEPSVTTGGIRPFRKDSGERRMSSDSAPKSGSNVKHEVKKAKVSPANLKKPSTGQIRRSVRDSLEEILLKRLKESDLKISTEKPAELAKRTEKELFALFQGVDSKYKNKYRSLTFNLKDSKNNVLFKRVLKGEVSPRDLVRMSAEELASKELAAWRQRENRHTIEMIEKEQREVERRPVTKITHKGEIEIENQEPAKAPEAIEPVSDPPVPKTPEVSEEKAPDSKVESPKKSKDTTSLHKSHLFDLHCKICTGRMAPPVEEATTKVVKVATTVIRRQSTAAEGEGQQATPISPAVAPSALVDDLSLRAMEEGLLNSSIFPAYEPRSESVSSKEDTAAFLANLRSLWNGNVDMPAVAQFLTKAYPVSGTLDRLTEDLPDSIQVGGRISPQIVWDYVEKIRASGTKEICVVRFTPDTEEDEISYTLLFAYFSSRRRYGVVANNRKQVKDMYLIPLGSTEKIPHQIVPFDGPGLETNRPNLLLGLIIRQRPKRDFGVILPSEVREAPSFSMETKPQVDLVQKTSVLPQDEDRNIVSTLGRLPKKDTASLIKSQTDEPLEGEDGENVSSLRFLPGVLTKPTSEKNVPAADDASNTPSGIISQPPATDATTSGSVTPKTPTTPRLDRFIIKKKEPKPVKTEQSESSSSNSEISSQGKEKESGATSGVLLSLKDKPGDVSTEAFLAALAAVQPKIEPCSTETKSDTYNDRSSQETNLLSASSVRSASSVSSAFKGTVNNATEIVLNNEDVSSPSKTLKPSISGILQSGNLSEPDDAKQPSPVVQTILDLAQSTATQPAPVEFPQKTNSAPSSKPSVVEFKALEDIQTISTISTISTITSISSSGKNEGLKQVRPRLLSPNPFNTAGHGPPPAPYPPAPYHAGTPDHAYHPPAPVHNFPPLQSSPAPFLPLHPQVPAPFSFPPGPPPMIPFPQAEPPWSQPVPPQACFPQPIPDAVAGPAVSYPSARFPDSTLPPKKDTKSAQPSYDELWDRQSRRSEDSFKKDDRDHYERHRHKSSRHHHEREKHRARSRSRSRSRSQSRSRHRHKSRHSRDDRQEERKRERHHSSHHYTKDKDREKERDRDHDKRRRDSDHEKHRKDSRDSRDSREGHS